MRADIAKFDSARRRAGRIRQRLEQEGAHPAARAAPKLAAYVPVDICGEMIEQEAAELRPDFPGLKVLPVTADISLAVSSCRREAKAAPLRVGFFPGSTIGNFEPHEAAAFLRNAAQHPRRQARR